MSWWSTFRMLTGWDLVEWYDSSFFASHVSFLYLFLSCPTRLIIKYSFGLSTVLCIFYTIQALHWHSNNWVCINPFLCASLVHEFCMYFITLYALYSSMRSLHYRNFRCLCISLRFIHCIPLHFVKLLNFIGANASLGIVLLFMHERLYSHKFQLWRFICWYKEVQCDWIEYCIVTTKWMKWNQKSPTDIATELGWICKILYSTEVHINASKRMQQAAICWKDDDKSKDFRESSKRGNRKRRI